MPPPTREPEIPRRRPSWGVSSIERASDLAFDEPATEHRAVATCCRDEHSCEVQLVLVEVSIEQLKEFRIPRHCRTLVPQRNPVGRMPGVMNPSSRRRGRRGVDERLGTRAPTAGWC